MRFSQPVFCGGCCQRLSYSHGGDVVVSIIVNNIHNVVHILDLGIPLLATRDTETSSHRKSPVQAMYEGL